MEKYKTAILLRTLTPSGREKSTSIETHRIFKMVTSHPGGVSELGKNQISKFFLKLPKYYTDSSLKNLSRINEKYFRF